MSNRPQMLFGVLLVLGGGGLLLANLLHISFWAICFPLGLILLGLVLLLVRPPVVGLTSEGGAHFVGDVIRSGEWAVTNEEFSLFVGDVRLDMSRAQFPAGETTIRLNGFVYDVAITVPSDIGVSLVSNGFVVDSRLDTQQASRFLSGTQLVTSNYMTAERKLRIVNACFVGNVRVMLSASSAATKAAAQTVVENGAVAAA